MKFRFIKHPKTQLPDPMLTATVFVIVICAIKFLFEGVSIAIAGHSLNLGHADALTYGALLTPLLGAHGYTDARAVQQPPKVDNPDASA